MNPMATTESIPPPAPQAGPVVLFDGVCNLCNNSVQFIIRNDPAARLRFAPLDSPAANALLAPARDAGLMPLPDSIVLVEPGSDGGRPRVSTRSTAILRIARNLRGPWPLAAAFLIIPRPLRDWAYNQVAKRRYRWFGKRDSCMMPTPELRSRFLA